MRRFRGIKTVEALDGFRLRLAFVGGPTAVLDLSDEIAAHRGLGRLREPGVWQSVRILQPMGDAVAFGEVLDPENGEGPIDIDGELLWRRAGEAAGELMPQLDFVTWRERHGLSYTAAATALGLSRRQVIDYASGTAPIPRTIMLACRGWEQGKRVGSNLHLA